VNDQQLSIIFQSRATLLSLLELAPNMSLPEIRYMKEVNDIADALEKLYFKYKKYPKL